MANKQHVFEDVNPPAVTPVEVGDHFIDTAAKNHYLASGVSSAADWTLVGSGSGGVVVYDTTWPDEGGGGGE